MLKLAKFLILLEFFYKMFNQMYPLHYLIKIAKKKRCFIISVKCSAPFLKCP